MYEVDFDLQVSNYGEEVCFPPERVSRVELSRIVVINNSYDVAINQSLCDRLHFLPDIQSDSEPYFDCRNPPPSRPHDRSRRSKSVFLRSKQEGQWRGRRIVIIDVNPYLQADIEVGSNNFPDLGFVWDNDTKRLVRLTSPIVHTFSSFREVPRSRIDLPTDPLRRYL